VSKEEYKAQLRKSESKAKSQESSNRIYGNVLANDSERKRAEQKKAENEKSEISELKKAIRAEEARHKLATHTRHVQEASR